MLAHPAHLLAPLLPTKPLVLLFEANKVILLQISSGEEVADVFFVTAAAEAAKQLKP